MVLEMKVPHGDDLNSLKSVFPVFLSYILSFINIGIYWNNHHHMMFTVHHVNGKVLWANIHLLFWLSLIPFTTAWMGENHFTKWPVALYGIVLLMAGIAYYIFGTYTNETSRQRFNTCKALGKDHKGIISVIIYITTIPLAFLSSWISLLCMRWLRLCGSSLTEELKKRW